MTTPSSTLSPGARDNFDTGPLSWVTGEIHEALNQSRAAIYQALNQDADVGTTSLQHAKSYLHQAHGALQMVDVDGVSILTETVEDLLELVDKRQLPLSTALADAVDSAYRALIEYLDELLNGLPHQPVRLFPYYRALLEVRGAERIHPADLFFPNLAVRPRFAGTENLKAVDPGHYVSLRRRFEQALLPFLRATDPQAEKAAAARMLDVIGEIEAQQGHQQTRSFWWVMRGLAEAVVNGSVPNEVYVKQLFARINLQIRRLCEGAPGIAERLLRDALFFIARAEDPTPLAGQIRKVYQLDGLVPADYDRHRYGRVNLDALVEAKERLMQAKSSWARIANGDQSAANVFERDMAELAEAGARLASAPLLKLLQELEGISRHAAHTSPGEALGLEMATSLLFIENALNHINRLSDDFGERAEAVTVRLLTVVAGDVPATSAAWLDDMSREAQQRQNMAALSAEMQTSLRQIEKMLDEYFRDPLHPGPLEQLDPVLHQLEGAFAVLDQEDAVHTLQRTRDSVREFLAAGEESEPDVHEFQQVAQNIGALSFFIDSLQQPPGSRDNQFFFDDTRGLLTANLLGGASPEPMAVDIEPDVQSDFSIGRGPENFGPPGVEEELAYRQQQSAELARSLASEPDNPALQGQLQASLELIRRDPALVDDPDANDRAKAGIDILGRADFSASRTAHTDIISATAPTMPVHQPLPISSTPKSDEEVDAELLEIFLLEAEEVLGHVRQTLPESKEQPHNQEHLTNLRRAFHTLKGSGRMVGLLAFGEAAWSIEQVLNLRLSQASGGDPELYALLEKATEVLQVWLVDLVVSGRSACTPDALIIAAERVRAGGAFIFDSSEGRSQTGLRDGQDSTHTDPLALQNVVAEDEPVSEECHDATDARTPHVAAPEEHGDANDADSTPGENTPEDRLALGMSNDDVLEGAAKRGAIAAIPGDAELAGADGSTEPAPLSDLATPRGSAGTANVIEFPTLHASWPALRDNYKRIGDLEISLPLHNIYLAETDQLVRILAQDMAEWRHEPDRRVSIQSIHAAHSLAGSSATVGFLALQNLAHSLEIFLQSLSRMPVELTTYEFDTLEMSVERIKLMLQKFALSEMPACQPESIRLLESLCKDIDTRAGITRGNHLPGKALLDGLPAPLPEMQVGQTDQELVFTPHDVSEQINATPREPDLNHRVPPETANDIDVPEEFSDLADHAYPVFSSPVADEESLVPREAGLAPVDDLDPDLMPVFLEEAREILPEMERLLRAWQEQTLNLEVPHSMLRLLHTLKGSARMAGAMGLGQHLHDMESRMENILRSRTPEPLAIDDLLIRYDQALQIFDQLQQEEPARQHAESVAVNALDGARSPNAAFNESMDPSSSSALTPVSPADVTPVAPPSALVPPATPPQVPLLRVRTDILDRLVNQAGEVSITRSKLESDAGTLKQSLTELTDNVVRLRDQLREIEMQAESQIVSRLSQSGDREFDPLEFDRFTRLQELARMMAETVSDVGSVHHHLSRTLDSTMTGLATQAQLTRDLQQDLMRVRMVQFASISERLYRVARKTAKEMDKRVNLDIRGSAVEIDRSVLEKMTGPFEHLLRNAIVHGIESRERRRQAGKNEVGELRVEIRQEGNEVVIQFSDDGRGLDLAQIRSKAQSEGLLPEHADSSDDEVRALIFHPGFSTADDITELAGRGIGMDVVRSEVATLGGRVSIRSESDRGTLFTIHLPLTLAVTQVVLLSAGGTTYAVPSILVEQVQQLKTTALATAYNDGAVTWQDQRVPMYYLSTLLGDKSSAPVSQKYSPLLILRSGNARVALHVDEIIGNREVVVKNIGPQLSRLAGIAGATVLGSGEIVLIVNPVPLATHVAHEDTEDTRGPRINRPATPVPMGAVAEMSPAMQPVQGLRQPDIVMVVDDSLTVRRVTQRLLSREGYRVVLAKDGVDALEHLQSVTPDVMLVDIEMPRMDGFDLTRNVRNDERTRSIPIIMITSRTAAKHRKHAFELGVNEYLGKPYNEHELLALIAGLVGVDAKALPGTGQS